eukprot:TRINITY_DN4348_c0_g1_i2.p1 TRINITY_DN4348_c0_g1~~TRINITY_DN4348_c0_g1_i2.p1  ORF type:complete len:421 (+),score=179.23 TRINITY_DN4348_c0_g1_i2:173-1264(+)
MAEFTYPKAVVGPGTGQEDAYRAMGMDGMVQKFIMEGQHCTLLAYGQTGAGKTHTMFGPGNLADPSEWGVFPRATMAALGSMAELQRGNGEQYVFTASAVEFYFYEAFDLLNGKRKVVLSSAGTQSFNFDGVKQIPIASQADVAKVMHVLLNERRARGTAMNERSSRSHCIATLHLTKVVPGPSGKRVFRSTFAFADLSGSERVSKTHFEKTSIPGQEGITTNFDLGMLHHAVEKAAQHRKKSKQPLRFDGVLPKAFGKSLRGESLTALVVCVSPAEKNVGETYFSLKWGSDMHRLRSTSCPDLKGTLLKAELAHINEELVKEQAAFENLEQQGERGRKNPYYPKREARVVQLKLQQKFLSQL